MKHKINDFDRIVNENKFIFHDSGLLSIKYDVTNYLIEFIIEINDDSTENKKIIISFYEIDNVKFNILINKESQKWGYCVIDYFIVENDTFILTGIEGWTIKFESIYFDYEVVT